MNDTVQTTQDLKPPLRSVQLFEAADQVWVYLIDGRMHPNVAHRSLAKIVENLIKIDPTDENEVGTIETEVLNEFDWELKLPDGTVWNIPDQELKFGEGIFYEFEDQTRFNRDTFVVLKTDSGELITVQFWFTIPHNVDQIWAYLDRAMDHQTRGQIHPEHNDLSIDRSFAEPTGDEDDDPVHPEDFDDTIPGGL